MQMISIFLSKSPKPLYMCSHLDIIVKYEITDENAKEAMEEASGSRGDDQHQTRT